MAFNMVTSGSGWRLAGSLIQLGHEVAAAHPDFTCLGTIGDASHAAEGSASDHNPWVKDASGLGVVRAIDIGGPDVELKALRQLIWARYAASDPRIFPAGYSKGCSDNLINNYGLPFGTHVDLGDAGHLHISVGLTGYDATNSWGISGVALSSAGATQLGDDDLNTQQDQFLTDIHNAVGRLDSGTSAGSVGQFTFQPTTGGSREPWAQWVGDIRNLMVSEFADAAKANVPTIDYTALAQALIAQLKAA